MRYGNVMGSRGSVIPFFLSLESGSRIPITDRRMTRFMIRLEEGVELVWHVFCDMTGGGGGVYVRKTPSMNIMDIAAAVHPGLKHSFVGIRPGEKLHEQMIGAEDAPHTYEYSKHFKIIPAIHNWSKDPHRIGNGKRVPEGFVYASDTNSEWMSRETLRDWIQANRATIGKL